jgi:hypothetical protein
MDWLTEARTATHTVPDFKFAEGGTLDDCTTERSEFWLPSAAMLS